ncbi:exopolysaccharide biosynthesis protein [Qipengyuania sp. JC766]|uniref:exopolysaccharide biosynthesis protein n=1 Tax=Qipengyuania sp. JC766 TaxID=3232139 RepID=UPI0034577F22
MSENPKTVGEILDALEEKAGSEDEVSIGDVVETFGNRSYGPFLLVPALIGVSPVGGIPGVPTILAIIVGLFAVQMVFGRRKLWLPAVLKDRAVDGEKLAGAADKMRGVGKWLDKVFRERIEWVTADPAPRIAAIIVTLICVSVPPLELLPFAVFAPMTVVAAFGLALLVRDGLLMLIAFVGSAAVFVLAAYSLLGGSGGGGG